MARDHIKVRKQFAQPLSANQVSDRPRPAHACRAYGRLTVDAAQHLQFKLADMATDVQTARTLVRQAAGLLDDKHPQARSFCAMAKRVATDHGFKVCLTTRVLAAPHPAHTTTAAQVCNDALQMHGGYGYLQDYPVERFVRDVRVHQILEGTNEIMRLIMARELLRD